ncbi:hypothetical protein [Archaeoglobus profundus]|uniref:Phage protein n=1 Tax=Archaeoglobus profundus (strain DSM 5631 / JCM 9629 / NBRC 100127 / Av18) TaxID=572546 RepID=D2REK4_ARCPA|nr:hypothetical protein [Archaeoglobus profundus]ADB58548.1 hypothetical protein Arcpr_1502 [Archaeoglobus profundus DSM 5631]
MTTLVTVSDVRTALGQAFATEPDDATVQSFIDEREAELKDIIKVEDLTTAPNQALLKKWLLNKVCIDVLKWSITGKSDQPLSYSIGELREDYSQNTKTIREWVEIMEQSAEQALQMWFVRNVRYRAVAP